MSIVVVGGGAAGILAAISAAENGLNVILLEKNDRLGKKLFITGKGRCNITNGCPTEQLMKNVLRNPRFLYSAFNSFDNTDIVKMLEDYGCPTKVERGDRVFPVSDRSSDVIRSLKNRLNELGVDIRLNTKVVDLIISDKVCSGVVLADGQRIEAEAVILSTGGKSYPSTGSDGFFHDVIKKHGHTVVPMKPALVPLLNDDFWTGKLAGLALKNIEIKLVRNQKVIYSDFGEMLFTHVGVSGPVILSASGYYEYGDTLVIDLKPALDIEKLDERLLRDFEKFSNKDFINALDDLFPKRLIPVIARLSGIDLQKKVHQITSEERKNFVYVIKNMPVNIIGTAGFEEAIITQGGLDVKEIDPSTMRSKHIEGLSFAGEMIDLDAFTGGFNLQIAWSTGYLAGKRVLW